MLSPGRSPDGGEPDLAAALVEATLADIVRGSVLPTAPCTR